MLLAQLLLVASVPGVHRVLHRLGVVIQVSGIEVSSIEVSGIEVSGIEVSGIEVSGIDLACGWARHRRLLVALLPAHARTLRPDVPRVHAFLQPYPGRVTELASPDLLPLGPDETDGR